MVDDQRHEALGLGVAPQMKAEANDASEPRGGLECFNGIRLERGTERDACFFERCIEQLSRRQRMVRQGAWIMRTLPQRNALLRGERMIGRYECAQRMFGDGEHRQPRLMRRFMSED